MATSAPGTSDRLLVVLMGLGWGFNWIAARFILEWLPPWTMRALGIGLGTLTIFAAASLMRVPLYVPRGQRLHVLAASLFNVGIFSVCSAYAQVYGTTSRAIVIAYSMPIWSAVLSRFFLKEKLDATRIVALGLCAAGLAILIAPLARTGLPLGALFALGCAWCWAAGTVYLKWAKIRATSLAITAWQLLFGVVVLAAGTLWFDGIPHPPSLPPHVLAWIAYNGLIGMGMAYFLWFVIIERLPAITASLGSLLVPVVGVIASAIVIGERPGLFDIVGFALIFGAAACVLLQAGAKRIEMPE